MFEDIKKAVLAGEIEIKAMDAKLDLITAKLDALLAEVLALQTQKGGN